MSQIELKLVGHPPGLLMHSWQKADLLTPAEEDEHRRIIAKTESKWSQEERGMVRAFDCLKSLWLKEGQPTVPPAVVRTALEQGARKEKMGGAVRESLLVESVDFAFDPQLGSTKEEWGRTLPHEAGVKVGQSRINRIRALFPTWSLAAVVTVFDLDLGKPAIDREQICRWATTAGQRIGIGDWRPQTSGMHGRFSVESCSWL